MMLGISRSAPGIMLLALLVQACPAADLSFTFQDVAGDPRDETDVTEVFFQFDNLTGDYSIKVTTDEVNPFNGSHLLYLSVFNADVGSTSPAVSFFDISRFSFVASEPTTMLTRSGTAPVLTHWRSGDRVASYDVLGVPDHRTSFVSVLGGNTASFSDSDQILDVAAIVPEPSSSALMLIAAGALAVRIRTRRLCPKNRIGFAQSLRRNFKTTK